MNTRFLCRFVVLLLLAAGLATSLTLVSAQARIPFTSVLETEMDTNPATGFDVGSYVVQDDALLPTNDWTSILSKYTGTNVSLQDIVQAATDVQTEYRNRGYVSVSIAVAQEQITNGVVTLNVFQTAIPQIVVSGVRYYSPTNAEVTASLPAIAPVLVPPATNAAPETNNAPLVAATPPTPATPEQIEQARAFLFSAMTHLDAEEHDTRIHVISTNAGPRFGVERYRIEGNTILTPKDLTAILTNIDGAYGTNVSFDGVRTVMQQLQGAYRDRGYVTVAVGLPKQKLTNATVKIQVTEGWLENINVKGNRYFSSNNVMRALPSIHTNMLLNGNILQAELNRANANQDRQIYPVIGPGPDPGSSALTLNVKDQLPLHAKLEFNNQNSPGTPDLRVNGSAVYDNLWQQDHALGVQYSFSPEQYKAGNQWEFYDLPAVANYSAFYRFPLGNPQSTATTIANNSSFGYDEATHKFNLPPMLNQPELTIFVGRSTIDTGVLQTPGGIIFSTNGNTLFETTVHQDQTVNNDIGTRLNIPLQSSSGFESAFSGGFDYKTYKVNSGATNIFTFVNEIISPPFTNTSPFNSPIPYTVRQIHYVPLMLRYDANWQDAYGSTALGLGVSANLWFQSQSTATSGGASNTVNITSYQGVKSLQQITGSTESHGNWVIVTPSFSRNIIVDNWITIVRADAQWASEPLISNEQFGIGGVNSVRGYHEGEVFGDSGVHLTLEQQTPQHIVGTAWDGQPVAIRGSIYTDMAAAYLIDPPKGEPSTFKLWGAGCGLNATIGSHWQAQFLFSMPLVSTTITPRFNPYFNFSVTAQF